MEQCNDQLSAGYENAWGKYGFRTSQRKLKLNSFFISQKDFFSILGYGIKRGWWSRWWQCHLQDGTLQSLLHFGWPRYHASHWWTPTSSFIKNLLKTHQKLLMYASNCSCHNTWDLFALISIRFVSIVFISDRSTILGWKFCVVSLTKDLDVIWTTVEDRPKGHKYQVDCIDKFKTEHQTSRNKTDCHEKQLE